MADNEFKNCRKVKCRRSEHFQVCPNGTRQRCALIRATCCNQHYVTIVLPNGLRYEKLSNTEYE